MCVPFDSQEWTDINKKISAEKAAEAQQRAKQVKGAMDLKIAGINDKLQAVEEKLENSEAEVASLSKQNRMQQLQVGTVPGVRLRCAYM